MQARNKPTAAMLRLREPTPDVPIDEAIRTSLGDPCYLHELGHRTAGWSRKQIEKAVKRLEQAGSITVLGTGNRRLYASPRRIPAVLRGLPARAIRLLQMMPLDGSITYAVLVEASRDAASCLDETAEAGLTARCATQPVTARLTPMGRRIAGVLGDGLRIDQARQEEVNAYRRPSVGDDLDVGRAIASREVIPEMDDMHERARIRRALCAHLLEVIDRENADGIPRKILQAKVDEWLEEHGHPSSKLWIHNLEYSGRLPEGIEVDALAAILGVAPETFGVHLLIAPWTIRRDGRVQLRKPRSAWRKAPSLMAHA